MYLLKKLFAGALIVTMMAQWIILTPTGTYAVATDGSGSTWTRDKALHLAQKALIGPTPQIVQELYQAGSASAAVNILFPSTSGPDRTQADADFSQFTGNGWMQYVSTGGVNYTNQSHMARLYQYQYARDPYEAKMKLFSLFEDIFSVNVMEGIKYRDVRNLHKLIYTYTLDNYKTLIKKTLLNNTTDKGDFAISQFLNNLRQWDKNNPNENYSRELLQLFLMGEYKPGDSKDAGSTRNYTEEDVAALARIVTGFWTDGFFPWDQNLEEIVYQKAGYHNRATGLQFLPGATGSIDAPYYNANNDTLDLGAMEASVNGNNGLADNTIDYIFAKRKHEISLFLAEKLFRFYVHENPTRIQLEQIATQIESYNFEMLPIVKWLLVQDFMYSSDSMNAILYKNPIELSLGLLRLIHARDPQTIDGNLYGYSDILSSLGWNPYIPGSIFGRDGHDYNYKWYSGYTHTQWINLSTRIFYDYTRTGAYLISNIVPTTFENGSDITMDRFIEQVEDNLLLGRRLPTTSRDRIKLYLTTSETGTPITFQPNNATYKNLKFPGVFAYVVTQPEYILKTGYDVAPDSTPVVSSKLDQSPGNLIVIELPGGYDWLHGMIKKSDYATYANMRTSQSGSNIVQSTGALIDVGDFYMNPYIAYSGGNMANGPGFKNLLDQGYLKVFHRVGTLAHSRDHWQAQRQMSSIDNSTIGGIGLLGDLTKFEPNAMNTIVLGNNRPNILQTGNYVNMGANDNRITNSNPYSRLNQNQKNQQINLIIGGFTGRTYPGKVGNIVNDAGRINQIATLAATQTGGSPGVGYTTKSQLQFAKTLLQNNIGKIMYLANTGNGYDVHENELTDRNLNGGIGYLAQTVTDFFLQVKDTEKVTIVIYSEFGRTNAMNGTMGTDHGEGGGMFVITNQPELQSTFTGSIYGNSDLTRERNNWMSPGIDYRSIYGKIISKLYSIDETSFFKDFSGSLAEDLSQVAPSFELLHKEFKAIDNTNVEVNMRYRPQDPNFETQKGSYTIAKYGTGGGLVPVAQPFYISYSGAQRIDNTTYQYVKRYGNIFSFNPVVIGKRFPKGTLYQYSLELVNNQFASSVVSDSFTIPDVIPTNSGMISHTSDSVLRKFTNLSITGAINFASTDFVIDNNTSTGLQLLTSQSGLQIFTQSGTTYVSRLSSTGVTWNGGYILSETLSGSTFIPKNAYDSTKNIPLSSYVPQKIWRMGPDMLDIDATLNQSLILSHSGLTTSTSYSILRSIDGVRWENLGNISTDSGGVLEHSIDHLGIYLLATSSVVPQCSMTFPTKKILNGTSTALNWSTFGGTQGISIDHGIGTVGDSGSLMVQPPDNANTTYMLSVSGPTQATTCQASIQTYAPPSCTITVSSASVRPGSPVTLSWTTTSTDHASLIAGSSSIVPLQGSVTLPVNSPTQYTLQVSNPVASGSCTVSVGNTSNNSPIAQDDSVSLTGSLSTVIPVLQNDSDPDVGDTIRIKAIYSPAVHGQTFFNSNTIQYRPNIGFCGTDSFGYTIEDILGSTANAQVQVQVDCNTDGTGSTQTGSVDLVLTGASFSGNQVVNLTNDGSRFEKGGIIRLQDSTLVVGTNQGSITLSGTTEIEVSSGVWNSYLEAPTFIAPTAGAAIGPLELGVSALLPQDVEVSQDTYKKYTHIAKDTFKAGGSDGVGLSLSGAHATIDWKVTNTSSGVVLRVFRSEDGVNWDQNYPNTTCIVNATGICQFATNHFTYFGLIETQESIVTNSISNPTSSGPGGGSYMSYVPVVQQPVLPISIQTGGVVSTGVLQQPQPVELSHPTDEGSYDFLDDTGTLDESDLAEIDTSIIDEISELQDQEIGSVDTSVISVEHSVFVRTRPNGQGKIIDTLYRHDRISDIQVSGKYCNIRTSRGVYGYIPCKYIRPIEDSDLVRTGEALFQNLIPNAMVDVAHSVFVRTDPNIKSKIRSVLGNYVPVFVVDSHGGWMDVLWENGHGYIYKKYIKMYDDVDMQSLNEMIDGTVNPADEIIADPTETISEISPTSGNMENLAIPDQQDTLDVDIAELSKLIDMTFMEE